MRNRFLPLHMGIAAALLVACGSQSEDTTITFGPDENDPFAFLEQGLTPLATTCTFTSTATPRVMTVTLAAGEMAFIKKVGTADLTDGDDFLQVNGAECNIPVPLAGSTSVQRLAVASNATAVTNESVVLDFTGGVYLKSTVAATPNITVNLGAGTGDMLGIRLNDPTPPVNEIVTYGATGINLAVLSTEVIRDIIPTGVEIHRVSLGDGDDTFTARGDTGTGAAFDPGTGGALEVYGGTGSDTFLQGPVATKKEMLVGGAGADTVTYSQRTAGVTVTLSAQGTTDNGDGDASEADDIKDDVELIIGGSGADSLVGGQAAGVGAETIIGNGGADTLTGGIGADSLFGGDGNDRFIETGRNVASGADSFSGGNGIDTIDYSVRTAALTVTLDGLSPGGLSGEGDFCYTDLENVVGGSAADVIMGNGLNNVFQGRMGADSLNGGSGGVDTVEYADRSTTVVINLLATPATSDCTSTQAQNGSGDADLICDNIENITGGSGADSLTGNNGANELVGGDGNDILIGNDGDDILEGGSATNAETNTLNGGVGIDVCYAVGAGTKTNCEF